MIPSAKPKITISHDGALQYASNTNNMAANAKSICELTDDVKIGLYSAAIRIPTTPALTAFNIALA